MQLSIKWFPLFNFFFNQSSMPASLFSCLRRPAPSSHIKSSSWTTGHTSTYMTENDVCRFRVNECTRYMHCPLARFSLRRWYIWGLGITSEYISLNLEFGADLRTKSLMDGNLTYIYTRQTNPISHEIRLCASAGIDPFVLLNETRCGPHRATFWRKRTIIGRMHNHVAPFTW